MRERVEAGIGDRASGDVALGELVGGEGRWRRRDRRAGEFDLGDDALMLAHHQRRQVDSAPSAELGVGGR